MAKSALRLEQLTKHFGRFKAVDSISLNILQGEVFTLLGPSGCGKTTTLRLIAGLESPDDGFVFFGDRTIVSVRDGVFVPTHKRNLGMVFQSYAIWPHMSVFDNVAYPLKVRRANGKDVHERVFRALELVGLAGLENRQGPQLSGGQQQRVALARALVHEPSILLLDEPFSNLDARLRKEMRGQLKLLLKQLGITTVFVTHDQIEALSMSDRIAVMRAGRIEQIDSPKVLYERPSTAFVRDFVGSTVLLQGEVGAAQEDRVSVHLEGIPGFALSVSRRDRSDLAGGGKVIAAIRPEDIQVLEAEDGPVSDCLSGSVESMLFVGDRYECLVRLCNREIVQLQMPRSSTVREGQTVRLKLAEEGIGVWRV